MSLVTDDMINDETEFIPLTTMPTGRLTDVCTILETKHPGVLNLDACLPTGNIGVLKTLLLKIKSVKSIKTLSLRFNHLGEEGARILAHFISENDFIEILYLLGTGIDTPQRNAIEEAWKKNLKGHKMENMGYTFIRVAEDPNAQLPKKEP